MKLASGAATSLSKDGVDGKQDQLGASIDQEQAKLFAQGAEPGADAMGSQIALGEKGAAGQQFAEAHDGAAAAPEQVAGLDQSGASVASKAAMNATL